MRRKLSARDMRIDYHCPRCGEESESVEHLMLKCNDNRDMRRLSPARLDNMMAGDITFTKWCFLMMAQCQIV